MPASSFRQRRALAITVRELRARRRMSQEELSYAAGRSRAYIGDLESGRRRTTFEGVVAIAHALDISMEELVRVFEARLAEQP